MTFKPPEKRIRLRDQQDEIAREIQKAHQLSETTARVLAARGFQEDKALRDFLSPELKSGLPHPEELKNLFEAANLIAESIKKKEKIAICSDFDVDGVSGNAQVFRFLQSMEVEVKAFIPDRFEDGYGLHTKIIDQIADEGFQVLIAIDFGTSNHKELLQAKKRALKTIVLDHHEIHGEIPPADVFINPHQEGCGFAEKTLCAAGLCWYLVVALRSVIPAAKDVDVKKYLDLACLGTICDMVPLKGANRVLAKRGLNQLAITEKTGLLALKNTCVRNKNISARDIAFAIGPRINAAGRVLHAGVGLELLITRGSEKAKRLAKKLNRLNEERQGIEEKIREEAIRIIQTQNEIPPGLVVANPEFHTGVIGLTAQRLKDAFYRPAVVMGSDKEGILKGSVRGIEGFNVVEALQSLESHLLSFGGHSGAGGLSIQQENIDSFQEAFLQFCKNEITEEQFYPTETADTITDIGNITHSLIEEFKKLEPFGMGNPAPRILLENLRVLKITPLNDKATGLPRHLKADFSDGKKKISGLLWRTTEHSALQTGSKVNIICRPRINEFRGFREIQADLDAIETL